MFCFMLLSVVQKGSVDKGHTEKQNRETCLFSTGIPAHRYKLSPHRVHEYTQHNAIRFRGMWTADTFQKGLWRTDYAVQYTSKSKTFTLNISSVTMVEASCQ